MPNQSLPVFGAMAPSLGDLMLSASSQRRFGLAPFDPAVNQPRDLGFGGPSTEFTATAESPDGQIMNYPTIWWDKAGNPHLLQGDDAWDMAASYEANTGLHFPRYPTYGAADFAAENRSAMGGGLQGSIAQPWWIRR